MLSERALTTAAPTPCRPPDTLYACAVELAAGVEVRHHGLEGGLAGAGVLVDGDAAAVVGHEDAAVLLDRDRDVVAEAGHRLVDGVVDDLVNQVVEAALIGGADVHAGPPPDCLQTFEDLDVCGGVL